MMYGGKDAVNQLRAQAEKARLKFERTGEIETILAYHNIEQTASHVGPMEYYMDDTRGGGVAEWSNSLAVMSWGPWLDFDPVSKASHVNAATLIIHSKGSALPDQARKVFDLLPGQKSIYWADGNHFDFYDQDEQVEDASNAAAQHFKRTLKGS